MKNIISKEEARKRLEKNGCKFRGKSTIVLAVSSCGTRQLEVAHVGSRTENRRRYTIYERMKVNHSKSFGMFEKSHMLAPDEMKDGAKIASIVLDLYGDYQMEMRLIEDSLGLIEAGRVLDIDSVLECDKMTPYAIIDAFKEWILENPCDSDIVVIEINKQKELGFYPGKEHFDKRFGEIAPDNDIKTFKSYCKREGLIKTNAEASRYTYKIEKGKAEKEGLVTNQIILFNLDSDCNFIDKFIDAKNSCNIKDNKKLVA